MKILPPSLLIALAAIPLLRAEPPLNETVPPPDKTAVYSPVPPVVVAPEGGVPSDAIVLFDGKNLDAWEPEKAGSPGWKLENGVMVVVPGAGDIRTKRAFGDIQLHIEFREPSPAHGNGQYRGNSGVFLMGLYELQIMDSYENPTYVNGQAGAMYKQYAPLVNPSRPPGVWQTYDVIFRAARFAATGVVISPARVTVFYNGVAVQADVALGGWTRNKGYPHYEPTPDKLPLSLQEHPQAPGSGPVAFRNIWVRELHLPPTP
jgi:hypothetical protein